MGASSNATPAAPAQETAATHPEKQDGFEAVELYNHKGESRVAETVADRVQAEFDGFRLDKAPKK